MAVLRPLPQSLANILTSKVGAIEILAEQLLQNSDIPTYHFQSALPKLPIPALSDTCNRFLTCLKPLTNSNAFEETKKLIQDFQCGPGMQLHELLVQYSTENDQTSYISNMWFEKYLKYRGQLPIHSNVALILQDDEISGSDQILRTTNLILSSLRFYKSLLLNRLNPEIFHLNAKKSDTAFLRMVCSKLPPKLSYIAAYLSKAYPLDMSQYRQLFGTVRLPDTGIDVLQTFEDTSHITVQCKSHQYALQVLDEHGNILAAKEIYAGLKYICEHASQQPPVLPIGILTTLERDRWAHVRKQLLLKNRSHLDVMETALFNVCMDDLPVKNDVIQLLRTFIHGDGGNRWFDKSFSLIVTKDAVAGINFEHSWGDGVAILRYLQDVAKDSKNNPQITADMAEKISIDSTLATKLDFRLDDELAHLITTALHKFKDFYTDLDLNYLIYEDLSKNLCKKSNVSPDAVMQLGFQLGFHKLSGSFVNTYESCSTSAFKHGRTEALRPLNMDVKDLVQNINSNKVQHSRSELKTKLLKCSDIHNRLVKEAVTGQGYDRHLYALNYMAEKNGIKSNLFNSPIYKMMQYDVLSTSTLNSPIIYAGAFGPVVPDGFGVGYSVRDDSLSFLASSYKSQRNGKDFIEAMHKSFNDIRDILSVH